MKEKKKRIPFRIINNIGNANVLLGAFGFRARREGWSEDEVRSVIERASRGDFSHLLRTISEHCHLGGMG